MTRPPSFTMCRQIRCFKTSRLAVCSALAVCFTVVLTVAADNADARSHPVALGQGGAPRGVDRTLSMFALPACGPIVVSSDEEHCTAELEPSMFDVIPQDPGFSIQFQQQAPPDYEVGMQAPDGGGETVIPDEPEYDVGMPAPNMTDPEYEVGMPIPPDFDVGMQAPSDPDSASGMPGPDEEQPADPDTQLVLNPPGPFTLGRHHVVASKVGEDGSSSILCQTNVLVVDETPPRFEENFLTASLCPSLDPVPVTTGCQAATPDLTGLLQVKDNCGGTLTISQDLSVGDMLGIGSYSVVFTATDASGNVASLQCPELLQVVDDEPLTRQWIHCDRDADDQRSGVMTPCDAPKTYRPYYGASGNQKSNGCPVTVSVTQPACQFCNRAGKVVDRLARGKCRVQVDDKQESVLILPENSKAVAGGDHVSFTVTVGELSPRANSIQVQCTICVQAEDCPSPEEGDGNRRLRGLAAAARKVKRRKENGAGSLKQTFQCPENWDPRTDSFQCP